MLNTYLCLKSLRSRGGSKNSWEWQKGVDLKEDNSTHIDKFHIISLLCVKAEVFFSSVFSRLCTYLSKNSYIDTSVQGSQAVWNTSVWWHSSAGRPERTWSSCLCSGSTRQLAIWHHSNRVCAAHIHFNNFLMRVSLGAITSLHLCTTVLPSHQHAHPVRWTKVQRAQNKIHSTATAHQGIHGGPHSHHRISPRLSVNSVGTRKTVRILWVGQMRFKPAKPRSMMLENASWRTSAGLTLQA